MATTQDYSAVAGPLATRYFAGGDAANWCLITPPKWAHTVTILNRGAGLMYCGVIGGGVDLTGAATATGTYSKKIGIDASVTLPITGDGWGAIAKTFSVWGVDGAAHAMDFIFDGRK